jgi:hypothetical protein
MQPMEEISKSDAPSARGKGLDSESHFQYEREKSNDGTAMADGRNTRPERGRDRKAVMITQQDRGNARMKFAIYTASETRL